MTRRARSAASGAARQSPLRRRLIITFVSFHLFAMLLFALPMDNPPVRGARALIGPYMRSIGMTEVWDMFAPNPKAVEQFIRAIVITRSGEYKLYTFPRMEELPLSQRYRKERYRKFAESILCADCAGLWPDVERGVARRMYDPADPPERVLLVKFEAPIDPVTGATGEDAAAKPVVFAQLTIQPEDLK